VPSHALRTPVSVESPASDVEIVESPATESPATRRRPLSRLLALLAVIVAVASLGACTAPNSSTKGDEIVNLARTHIGQPYVYGAAGPYSFDCSGLVQYVHRQAGISIPRTTETQLAAARPISKSAAQPGDIVFIGNYHVGIYVGGGQMIDAPKTGDVVRQRPIWTSAYTIGRLH
jgi:cell wall-associated NlpC family hydrolase